MVFVAIARSLPAFPRSRPVYRQGRSGSGATGQADRPRNRSLSAFALTVGWSAWFLCWTKAMPVSESSSKVVYEALRASGVRLVSALPETWLVHLIRMADDDPEMILVRLAKEEEGVGNSMGAHLAGLQTAMLMQNHGFFAAINGIISGAMLYKIPLLMLISDRGFMGERDPWQTEGDKFTRRTLEDRGIVQDELTHPDDAEGKVAMAMTLARASLSPVALLLSRGLMWEEPAA